MVSICLNVRKHTLSRSSNCKPKQMTLKEILTMEARESSAVHEGGSGDFWDSIVNVNEENT